MVVVGGHTVVAALAVLASKRLLDVADGAVLIFNEQDDIIALLLIVLVTIVDSWQVLNFNVAKVDVDVLTVVDGLIVVFEGVFLDNIIVVYVLVVVKPKVYGTIEPTMFNAGAWFNLVVDSFNNDVVLRKSDSFILWQVGLGLHPRCSNFEKEVLLDFVEFHRVFMLGHGSDG